MSFISDLLIEVSSFRIKVGEKLNTLADRIGTLANLTTTNKNNLVEAVNELNSKSFTISVGNEMGEINQTNGNTIYPNSIAIYNKQDANTHPKNSAGLEAFSYNAPSAVNYPVVAGAGGGGGISFYRSNTTAGLLSSFDIVKAEHSEEKLRFRVGVGTATKGNWKIFASEEYVDDAISGLGLNDVGLHKTKRIAVTNSYRRAVIPLVLLDNSTIGFDSYFFGEIHAKRNNGFSGIKHTAKISAGKFYNQANPVVNVSYEKTAVGNIFFRPVTFLYNGLKYFGIELGSNSANFTHVTIDGIANDWSHISVINYLDTQNNIVLNPEINSSIQEYTYVSDDYSHIDKSLNKLEAEAFIKNGGDNTNVLLDGGNVKPLSDFALANSNDYWTTATNQTGLSGSKETTGTLILNGTQATSLFVYRTANTGNSSMAYGFDGVASVYTGAGNANTFVVAGTPALSASTNQWLFATATGVGTRDLPGSYLYGRDVGGFTVEKVSTAANWSSILRHRFTNADKTFGLGGIHSSNGAMSNWGMFNWDNSDTVNAMPKFFGWQGNTDLLRASSLAGTGDRIVYSSSSGNIYNYNINPVDIVINSQLSGYVQQSALNTQLANYVTLNSVQTITATKTYTVSPVVPNGTLAGHTVNLGQLNTILNAYALASAIPTNNNQLTNGAGYITASALGGYATQTWVNSQNFATQSQIITPNNGSFVVQGVGALTGAGTTSANASSNTVATLDLTSATKNQINEGVNANSRLVSMFGSAEYFRYWAMPSGGTVDVIEAFFNLVNPEGNSVSIDITDHEVHGARLVLKGLISGGLVTYNINAINDDLSPINPILLENSSIELTWDNESKCWRTTGY